MLLERGMIIYDAYSKAVSLLWYIRMTFNIEWLALVVENVRVNILVNA